MADHSRNRLQVSAIASDVAIAAVAVALEKAEANTTRLLTEIEAQRVKYKALDDDFQAMRFAERSKLEARLEAAENVCKAAEWLRTEHSEAAEEDVFVKLRTWYEAKRP